MSVMAPNDRQSAVMWSRSVISVAETVFLDTETTGLGPGAEIVDIAVVSATGDVLLDVLVRPNHPIPVEATRIHGISNADVITAASWCDVFEMLAPILEHRQIVVYNASFDRTMVRQCCDRVGVPIPTATWLCAMKAYAAFREERGRGRGGHRWHSLPNAAAAFGLRPGGHRALADAEVCRRVVMAMAQTDVI
jgi:DNA polymerase III epsilon subunit-like protein